MPHVSEQELFCPSCRTKKRLPMCCGRKMEKDELLFFCHVCNREISIPVCCGNEMEVRTKVLDIKKEIFKKF